MTIDDKIKKLRSEIHVAENALKEKVSDVNFAHLLKDLGGNLIGSLSTSDEPNSSSAIASYLPKQWKKKYGYVFNLIQRLAKIMN